MRKRESRRVTNHNKMSAVSSARPKKVDPLSKKIPQNPKYKHVKATVDTGCSVSRYLARIEELKRDYKFKKDEIFKRMKVSTLIQLIVQIAKLDVADTNRSFDGDLGDGDRPSTADQEVQKICDGEESPPASSRDGAESSRSTLQHVIRGVGEIDMDRPPPPPKNSFVDDLCPYLLLDIRDEDSYNQCHIISAKSYPRTMLTRSVNYETKDLLVYRNQTGKIIILYDEDERLAHDAATTFVQRGYDNIFLLSGGLKVAYKNYPEGLITGTPPMSVTEKKLKTIEPADQKHFCSDDIDRLSIYLDHALKDQSIGSRLSRASTTARTMSQQSTKSNLTARSSLDHRPTFKP
ncbi:centrosomal protein of 41 kDa-like isoform X2 [Haliotis rufescens]|uniref:centrosomal protein of 41 kDa-like isoform X2 n=1 Tax=Haliotis rufescens TaxID=6454 RepID=UPI001EB0A81B|nr:centrosomal protein of 41 kDa-like isoform X2 [Haliotis rufescens]